MRIDHDRIDLWILADLIPSVPLFLRYLRDRAQLLSGYMEGSETNDDVESFSGILEKV